MACLLVPAAAGVISTTFRKNVPKQWHIHWLNTMLWGGVIALAVEHIAHKEIVPYPPFLTAMASPADTALMFNELAMVGIPMTLALVAVWIAMVIIYEKMPSVRNLSVSVLGTYKLDFLGLMLLGTLVMMAVDSSLILLGTALGFAMVVPLFILWAFVAYSRIQPQSL